MFQELSNFLLSGNNEILMLVIVSILCIGPLILMWRSTYVANRPYNLYATIPPGMPTAEPNAANQAWAQTGGGTPQPSASTDTTNPVATSTSATTNSSAPPDTVGEMAGTSAPIPNIFDQQSSEAPPPTQSSANTDSTEPETSQQRRDTTIPELLPEHFYIRLKFLDETVQVVQAKPTDTVEEFRRKIFPESLLDRYRLIFKGSVLRNTEQTMRECGVLITESSVPLDQVPVIHCFLAPPSPTRQGSNSSLRSQASLEDLSVGHFFLPLLGSILSFLWYLCIYYTSLFTIPSLFGIIALSCFFVVLVVNRFL